MSSLNFKQLSQIAQDAGYDTTELAPGTYETEVRNGNFTTKSNGKEQFGFRFVVLNGPAAGQGVWKNLNVPTPDSKPGAVAVFIREVGELGIDTDMAERDPSAAAAQIVGRQFVVEVQRTRPKTGGGFWTDVKIKGGLNGVAPAGPIAQMPQQFAERGAAIQQAAEAAAPAGTPAWQQSRPV